MRKLSMVQGTTVFLALVLTHAPEVLANEGEVRLPLNVFTDLQSKAGEPKKAQQPPPIPVTLSQADISASVPEDGNGAVSVEASVTVHVLGEEWVSVPLLAAGSSVSSATSDGQAIALSTRHGDLVWATNQAGVHHLKLSYSAQVRASAAGRQVHFPVPPAAAINLQATIPGVGLIVSVVPVAAVEVSEAGSSSSIKASLPTTSGVLLAWQVPAEQKALILGARYSGKLRGKVMQWRAEIKIKALSAGSTFVPLLEAKVALAQALVDGRAAVMMEQQEQLGVQLPSAGMHEVLLDFETTVDEASGPPTTKVWLPRSPVSTFSLDLPGKKEVVVIPAAGVEVSHPGGNTLATVHLPPVAEASFSWSEAVPEVAKENVRANAEVFHLVRAEEGVLQVDALVAYEVTRGATNLISVVVPNGVVVNRVTGDGVIEWRAEKSPKGQRIAVYLDRAVRGEYHFQVSYELLVGAQGAAAKPATSLAIPLLSSAEVHRQRGMVALLGGTELEVRPEDVLGMNKVGENQLPAWVRTGAGQTVAHTFKYAEADASLSVTLAPPEHKRGKYDVAVDTLFSVGDGVLKASASIEVTLKGGTLMDLTVNLPEGINVVGVTAPSLREHKIVDAGDKSQVLQLMFTQEMEGSLRIEVAYERALSGEKEKIALPTLHVPGADLEQGRMAVEALAAVEVQAAEVNRLLPVDVQDLPRQLSLRTTSPVLMAYKYVHADPPSGLTVEVRRHAELKVQVAAIDRAEYQTLYTRHGLALTRAVYQVRNRRKQFLSVQLPADSELWSAQLAGQPVKPASGENPSVVLVPLINSSAPFQVEIVYKTSVSRMGFAGWQQGSLPIPDVVETQTNWDVFLPEDLEYGSVGTNMNLTQSGGDPVQLDSLASNVSGQKPKAQDGAGEGLTGGSAKGVLPIKVDVPQRGIHFRFEKLFSNEGEERAGFSVRYTTGSAHTFGGVMLVLSMLALAYLFAGRQGWVRRFRSRSELAIVVVVVGVTLFSLLVLGANALWGIGTLVLLAGLGFGRWWLLARMHRKACVVEAAR